MSRPFKPMKDLDMDKVISDIVADLSNAGWLTISLLAWLVAELDKLILP